MGGTDGGTDPVEAVGRLTEALEWVERARGHLYEMHHLIGHADGLLDEAAALLDAAGDGETAERVRTELVGRNVLEGRWTFQVLEEFEASYYEPFRAVEAAARDRHTGSRRHVYEARLKEQRRSSGRPGHEGGPGFPR